MDGVKKNFGFGCMRLPLIGETVNNEEMCRMVDYYLENGFNYFDTAHGYLDGKSEIALRECLTSRHKREDYILTNKLTGFYFKSKEEIRPLFEAQLEACGVDYFDYYLMHAQSADKFEHFKNCEAYETAFELKNEGKVKHVGISFHDTADVLDRILTEYPQVEIVQLQFNYIDYEDPAVQSRKCYEVCRKHNKPVIVMEPVKGGTLVKLPDEAKRIFDELNGGSYANYAIRFAASFEGIEMVLSGMSSFEQMLDNVKAMKNFKPFTEKEYEAVGKIREVFRGLNMIPCTACRYCEAGCPKQIHIPDLFSLMNAKKIFNDFGAGFYYNTVHTSEGHKASDCIRCGKCETACPQHLPIRELLGKVADEFEKN